MTAPTLTIIGLLLMATAVLYAHNRILQRQLEAAERRERIQQ